MYTQKQFSFAFSHLQLVLTHLYAHSLLSCLLLRRAYLYKLSPCCHTQSYPDRDMSTQSAHSQTLALFTHANTHSQTRGKPISLTDMRLAAWRAEGAEKVITRDRRTCVGFTSSPPHSNLHLSQLPSHHSHWVDLIGRSRCFRDRFHVSSGFFLPSPLNASPFSATGGAALWCVAALRGWIYPFTRTYIRESTMKAYLINDLEEWRYELV